MSTFYLWVRALFGRPYKNDNVNQDKEELITIDEHGVVRSAGLKSTVLRNPEWE